MTRTRAARLMGLTASVLAAFLLASGGVAAAQSQAQEMLICHRTGSPTNPWVFMSIDASTWPEHEAQGDVRANSLADCAPPAAPAAAAQEAAPIAPAPAAQEAAPVAPGQPAQAAIGVPQASPAQSSSQVATPAQSSSQVANPAQASSGVASTAESPPQVANAQVASPAEVRSQVAQVQARSEAPPPVSNLPASGEPDRPALVAGLLTLLVAGLGLRRLGRRRV